MSHGLSKFFRCHSCLAGSGPCRLVPGPLSMPSTLAVACTPDHYLANLALFLTWITGGIFLLVGGLLAFVRFRFQARKSDPLSGPTQVYRSSEPTSRLARLPRIRRRLLNCSHSTSSWRDFDLSHEEMRGLVIRQLKIQRW